MLADLSCLIGSSTHGDPDGPLGDGMFSDDGAGEFPWGGGGEGGAAEAETDLRSPAASFLNDFVAGFVDCYDGGLEESSARLSPPPAAFGGGDASDTTGVTGLEEADLLLAAASSAGAEQAGVGDAADLDAASLFASPFSSSLDLIVDADSSGVYLGEAGDS
ncbi:hypothetical protein HK405_007634, partial [Cladochytrium tenue]